VADYPFPKFFRVGFRVFLNTDDRLMSATQMSKALEIAVEAFDLSLHDLQKMTVNTAKSSFTPSTGRVNLIHRRILPSFDVLLVEQALMSFSKQRRG